MDDQPQGGAGGAPFDDTDQKHLLHGSGRDPVSREPETDPPDSGGDGGASTLEPGRARDPERDGEDWTPEEDEPADPD